MHLAKSHSTVAELRVSSAIISGILATIDLTFNSAMLRQLEQRSYAYVMRVEEGEPGNEAMITQLPLPLPVTAMPHVRCLLAL